MIESLRCKPCQPCGRSAVLTLSEGPKSISSVLSYIANRSSWSARSRTRPRANQRRLSRSIGSSGDLIGNGTPIELVSQAVPWLGVQKAPVRAFFRRVHLPFLAWILTAHYWATQNTSKSSDAIRLHCSCTNISTASATTLPPSSYGPTYWSCSIACPTWIFP